MASGRHHHVGSPPRGPQTYVTKASKATSSRIASGLKPNLLTTAEAYSLVATAWQWSWATCEPQVALPLLGTWLAGAGKTNSLQFCWKRKHGCQQVGWPPLGLQTWITKAIRPHQAGSSPPWNPTSLSPQPCPVGTAWQCPWATCEPQVALPLLGNLACWGSQNQQPPALLRT